ncbi:LacI family DNA-binding transcriptional regulator [Leuconostoc pseudomesenteroides]|uniref:LacI family DNA-binding transcriptional regulator n=1 Tax=Leuconostoc pseudomesenteroides TaxID=33968 RepID=UPI001F553DA5|nr:LacI family DNA-binding transcriptional regulator [Leuconostoc pseudomesenteroides]
MKNNKTMRDVAEIAQVSKTTVSRYINGHTEKMSDKTQRKIEKTIDKIGYRVNSHAQSLAQRRTFLIGMVVADMTNMFSSLLFNGADEIANNQNYQIILMTSSNSVDREKQQINKLLDMRVDGLILQPIKKDAMHYNYIKSSGTPTVIVDRSITSSTWPEILTDNYKYSHIMTEYIYRKGYHKIVVVSEQIDNNNARISRIKAVQDVARKQNIDFDIIEMHNNMTDSDVYNLLIEKTNLLQEKVALYVIKGDLLLKIVKILIAFDISFPDKIGIAAFDDWIISELINPPITTIRQDAKKMGQVAVSNLIDMIEHDTNPPKKISISSELIIQRSL